MKTTTRMKQQRAYAVDYGSRMSDRELLQTILSYALPQCDVESITNALLKRFHCLEGVIAASISKLAGVPGLGGEGIGALKIVHSAGIRFHQNLLRGVSVVENWDSALSFLRVQLAYEDREMISVLLLDRDHQLLVSEVHSVGGVATVSFYPNDIIKRAKEAMASSLIVAHNHPSGCLKLTCDDVVATLALDRAATASGLKLLDSIIVGKGWLVSLRRQGLLD